MEKYVFNITEENACVIATFGGSISTHAYSDFRNDYNEICRHLAFSDTQKLVIDLTDTTYFGSLFIGMIVKISVSMVQQNGQLVLCGLSDQLKDLMKKLLLLERQPQQGGTLKHVATRAEAIQELQAENA